MADSHNEHLSILPALVRCALPNASAATRHQVQRLIDALETDGESALAEKLRESLTATDDYVALQQMIDDAPKGSPRRRRLEAALAAYRGPALRRSNGARDVHVQQLVGKLPRSQGNVIFHLVRGKTDGEIAEALGLSINTIRNHVKALFKKFAVRTRAALVAKVTHFN
jgi:DNA-binding NarL/FixJ family response regulator